MVGEKVLPWAEVSCGGRKEWGGRTAGGVEVAEVGVEVFRCGGDGEVLEDGAEG